MRKKKVFCQHCHKVAVTVVDKIPLCPEHYFLGSNEEPQTYNNEQADHWSALLRELRQERKLSQRELADMAHLSQRTVAEYENTNKPRQLSIYKVEKLLDAMGYDLDAIARKRDD